MSGSTSLGSQVIYTSQLLLGTTGSEQTTDWHEYVRHDFSQNRKEVWGEGSSCLLTVLEDRGSQWGCLGKEDNCEPCDNQFLITGTWMRLCSVMCTQVQVPLGLEKNIRSCGVGVTGDCEPPSKYWQPNSGPLEEPQVLWTVKPPILPLNLRTL